MGGESIPGSHAAQRAVNAAATVMAVVPRDAVAMDATVVTVVIAIGASTIGIRTGTRSGIGTSTRVRQSRR